MPSFRAAPVRVRTPGSSANLGPGFDAFGLALGVYDDIVVRVADSGLHVDVAGEGEDRVARNERNLVVRAIRGAFAALGGQPHGLEVVCANRIPHDRGLGSSAAAIVSGMVAARALVPGGGELLDDPTLLALATELEGHPDNVAASLLGGLTIAWRDGAAEGRAVRLDPAPGLTPVAFVPTSRSSTAKARALLPESVPHADAARNAGRAALLVHALTSAPELLMEATEDWLHQRYREKAMPRSLALVAKLRASDVPAVVSGAGPAVLAFPPDGADLDAFAGRSWTVRPLPVDVAGARVLAL